MSRHRDGRARAAARALLSALLLAGPLTLAAGCGSDEEARLEKLSEELGQLREAQPDLVRRVADREAKAKAAQDELAQARGALRDSEKRMVAIEKEVGAHATDPLLFRMIQKQLLEDDDLEDVAISAKVERGAVTLSGVVPNAKLRDRALALAEAVPGVLSVQDRIQVAGSKPPAP